MFNPKIENYALRSMILKVIIINALLLIQTTAQICDSIYRCGDKQLIQNKCWLKTVNSPSNGITTYLLSKCPSSQTCITPVNSDDNFGYCITPVRLGLEHESCNYHSECSSNICANFRCIPKDNGADCTSDGECGNGSSCAIIGTIPSIQRKCKELSNIGERCLEDRECPFNYACGTDNIRDSIKRCIQMHVIDVGSFSSNPWLCRSELIAEVPNKGTLCALSRWVFRDEITCIAGSKCRVLYYFDDNTPSFEGEVDCKCSANGIGYCDRTTDSMEMRNYWDVYDQMIAKVDVYDKHIALIRENGWDNIQIIKALRRVVHYSEFLKADECAIQYLSSHWIGRGLALVVMLIFVFDII